MKRAFVAVVVAAIVLNVLKALPHVVLDVGFPHWLLTYDEGFIRRGLVGTLVHELFAGFGPDIQRRKIIGIHVAVAFAFIALLCVWAVRTSRRVESPRTRAFVLSGTAALMLSHFPTTTLANCGYLDVFILSAAAAGAYLAERDRLRTAAIVAAIGPFVHEGFIFLWLPVMLVAARRIFRLPRDERRAALRRAAPLASAVVTTALVMLFHSQAAALRLIDRMPIGSEVKESFRRDQFGLSIGDALATMAGKYAAMPDQFLLACAFFLPPIVVAALCAHAIDRDPVRSRRALFAFAVTFAPCTVLLVAWDLSRFLTWAGLGALVLLISNANDALSDARTITRAPLVALAALAFLSTGPFVYAHFEGAWADYRAAPSFARRTPGAKLTYAFLRLYDRRLFVHDWVSDADGGCELEAPFVEKSGPCAFVLRAGQDVDTKDFSLAPGTYETKVHLTPAERCPSNATPIASIVPNIFWRFGAPRSATRVSVTEPATTTIPFSIDAEESAIAQTEVRISAVEGCFRVDRVSIVRTDDR